MKFLKHISLFAVAMVALVACTDQTPDYGNFPTKDVDFTFNVDGDQYTLDFYVVSTGLLRPNRIRRTSLTRPVSMT